MHPVEIAGQIALLDAAATAAPSWASCAGAWLDELGVAQARPVVAVREAWEVVRRLLAGDRRGLRRRALLAAAGPRAALRAAARGRAAAGRRLAARVSSALAGELADELKVGGSANPAMVAVARERLAVGAARAGRRADASGSSLGAVTVVDEDGAQARALARRKLLLYLPVVARLDPTAGVDAELLARLEELSASRGATPRRRR